VFVPTDPDERRYIAVVYEPIDRTKADRMAGRASLFTCAAVYFRGQMGFQIRAAKSSWVILVDPSPRRPQPWRAGPGVKCT
jgi:hypothetical protein